MGPKPCILLLLLILPLLLNVAAAAKERCHPEDKKALLRIKEQSFPNSTDLAVWIPTTDCCGWPFTGCNDTTNRTNSIYMPESFDTKGAPFPSAIGDLPYLESILMWIEATGPIPHSLSNLRRLTLLTLKSNRLSGPIPAFLGSLNRLTDLDLSNNSFSGNIPPSLALIGPQLATLDLGNNRLTGPIPDSFGSFKNTDMNLVLSNNKLSGQVPRSLGNVKFASIQLAGNRLKGDPSFLFDKEKLIFLDLSRNRFRFNMTGVVVTERINYIDLSHNRIYGSLPEGLAHLPDLGPFGFNVSYNRLCGPIPAITGSAGLFDETCYSHNKCLCGTPLPPCK